MIISVASSVDSVYGIQTIMYTHTRGCAEKFEMTSYLLLINFLTNRTKQCNTHGRSVWIIRGTILKNKPHLMLFHESILVSLRTFQPTLMFMFTQAFVRMIFFQKFLRFSFVFDFKIDTDYIILL